MNKSAKRANRLSRREFARGGAVAVASAAVALPESLIAQTDVPQGALHEPALSASLQAEADATVASILRKYGNILQDVEKLDVRRLVNEGMRSLEQIRGFSLNNSDQPANVLRLFPDVEAATLPGRPVTAKPPQK